MEPLKAHLCECGAWLTFDPPMGAEQLNRTVQCARCQRSFKLVDQIALHPVGKTDAFEMSGLTWQPGELLNGRQFRCMCGWLTKLRHPITEKDVGAKLTCPKCGVIHRVVQMVKARVDAPAASAAPTTAAAAAPTTAASAAPTTAASAAPTTAAPSESAPDKPGT